MLSETAKIGDSTIKLKESVDWEEGEEIVFAITGTNRAEFETRTIKSVIDDKTIEISDPLRHNHYSGIQSFGGKDYEIRGEVGLLTRNIKIQGDQSTNANKYGVHIMLRGDEDKVIGRLSYIEVTKCGQAF